MTHWRRTAFGLAGAVAIAAIAGGFALHALVDPARLAREAHDRARDALGRDLRLGAVHLDFLPRPTLVAENLVIANPPWAHERELVHARQVVAHLALWPLLIGNARVTSVSLDGAQAHLEVRGDGAKSWEISAPQPQGASPRGRAWLEIESVQVTNAIATYRGYDGVVDTWRVARASADMDAGLRDVRITAALDRNGHPLEVQGRFADLARLGQARATTPGELELDWGGTRFTAKGTIPLDHDLEQATFDATLRSDSLQDVLAFFGKRARHTAPMHASAKVTRSGAQVKFADLDVSLGAHRVTGEADFTLGKRPGEFHARLASDDLDWGQALVDAGDEKPRPPPAGEMFPVRPLPWGMLEAMQGRRGAAELRFGRLLLPDGIELRDAAGTVAIDSDHLRVDPFSAKALGGSVHGTLQLEAGGKAAQVALEGEGVLLERWFRERHRPVHFRGGPMKIRATIHAHGASFKELAGSMSGPVSILMGPGVYDSKVAGDWEARMVNFAKDSAKEIDFQCVGAALPFESGRAKGDDIVGARSRESRLLLSGDVDLRAEEVDLKGRERPRPDQGVGLSTIADKIEISGKLRHMKVQLDPGSKPSVIAKAGLAIVTAGISAVASAASNSAAPDPDPCEQVFSKRHPPHP